MKYSRRARRISLRVEPERITITLPWGTPEYLAERLLVSKLPWIRKKLESFRVEAPPSAAIHPFYGEEIWIFGVRAVLAPAPAGNAPELRGEEVLLGAKYLSEKAIRRWLDRLFTGMVKGFADGVSIALGTSPARVRLGTARTRWGSCSAAGVIMVNRRLVHAPTWVTEYVVAHELTHLIHRDHSRDFWDCLRGTGVRVSSAKEWLRHRGAWLLTEREAPVDASP